jgi:L-aspartate semialdehyde sulfurtransferase ferredoxin
VITRKVLLHFPRSATDKPVVYHLVRDYQLVVNIFRASVTPEEDGYLVLDVSGSEEDIRRGMEFARSEGIQVDESSIGVARDEGRCTHCGNCLAHCPTHALHVADPSTRRVEFDPGLCVECLSCLKNCPFGACSSIF